MIPINRARQLIYIMESHWRSGLPLQSRVQGKRVTRLGRPGDSTSVSAGVHKYVAHQQTAGELQRAASLSLEAGKWRWGWCGSCCRRRHWADTAVRGLPALRALKSPGLARSEKLRVRAGRWAGLTQELQTKIRNLGSSRRKDSELEPRPQAKWNSRRCHHW